MNKQVISQYKLPIMQLVDIQLPVDAKVLSVINRDNTPILSVMSDPENSSNIERRTIACHEVDNEFEKNMNYNFISTVVFYNGDLILHYFEILKYS